MKKIITLFALLFIGSLAYAQYTTSYQTGVSDITSHLDTTNAWVQVKPVGTCTKSVSIGPDGYLLCANSTGTYHLNQTTDTWDATGMGTSMVSFAVQNASNILALGPGGLDWTASCLPGGQQSVLKWSGTAWTPMHGCLVQIYPYSGGFVGTDNHHNAWKLPNGASAWTQIASGTLNYVAGASDTSMCGTTATQVFLLQQGGTFAPMTAQPASSGIAGCVMTTDNDSMFVWGTFSPGVKRFDFKTGTWNNVVGMTSPHGMATGRKGATLALSNIGNVLYHLNVYAGFVQGTTTGSVNGCPSAPCGNGVIHNGTLQVTLPHGMYGLLSQEGVSPTTNMNVSAFDVSPSCDAIFGDPNDPECQASATGSVICSQSGANFQGGGPPQPPHIGAHFSEWVGSYNGNYVIDKQTVTGPPNNLLYVAEISCGAINTCKPGTSAVCAPPKIAGVFDEGGAQFGPGASALGALAAAVNGCKKHSLAGLNGEGPKAWGAYSNYDVIPGLAPLCTPTVVFDATPYVSICY